MFAITMPAGSTEGSSQVFIIAEAAPVEVSIALETDGQVVAAIPIAAEATTGSLEIPIQFDTPPVTVTLTARSGASQASVDLAIQ